MPDPTPLEALGGERLAANSASVAGWTIVSRLTGFARIVVVAAVLGPSFVGNVYLATSLLPNLALELVTGSLLGTVLVPSLVRALDSGDARRSHRLAGGYLGSVLVVFVAVAVVATLAGPLILELFVLGVDDPAAAADQQRIGWLLMALMMIQVPLYGIAFTGAAAMNARGRFGLAAAAPVVENAGVIATMGLSVVLYGAGPSADTITTPHVVLLGAGTTAAVALHALLQWAGAAGAGVRLVPQAGWRNPEVQVLLRRSRTTLGQAALSAGRSFAALAVANSVAGGVIAFRLGLNFFYLPVMVGARPIAVAFQPLLARLFHREALARFRAELLRGVNLVLFLAVPAGVAYAVLAEPLARGASLGEMSEGGGESLVAVSLAGLALGVIGESVFMLCTHAAYARDDARAPLRGTIVGTLVMAPGMGIALALDDPEAILFTLGLSMSLGMVASAWFLSRRLTRDLPPSDERLASGLRRTALAAIAMAIPAYAAAAAVRLSGDGEMLALTAMLAAVVVGGAIYLGLHRRWRSVELRFFTEAVRGRPADGG